MYFIVATRVNRLWNRFYKLSTKVQLWETLAVFFMGVGIYACSHMTIKNGIAISQIASTCEINEINYLKCKVSSVSLTSKCTSQ